MKTENKQNKALNKTDVMQSVIKGQELRIGNLANYNGNNNEIGIVSEIFKNDLTKVAPYKIGINHRVDIYYDIDKLKPIPLTEEWLLKFGFIIRYFNEDKTKPLFWKVEQNRHIDIYFEPVISAFAFKINSIQYSAPIKSVHQLQNLYFALTGSELTVA